MHRACLLLHHETNIERIEFSLRFLYAPSLLNNPCPWKWKEMEAQHIDHSVPGGNMTLVVPQIPKSEERVPKSSLRSSMRNTNLSTLPSRPKVNWTNPPSPAADSTHQTTGPTVITDLYSIISSCDPASDIFGLLEGDEDSYVLQRGAETRPPVEAYQTVSLESLLNKSSGYSLDRRQRYQIAFTLASSHLQLYPSPWLHSHWTKKDIMFNLDPHHPNSIQIDQPYMLHAVSVQKPPSTPSYASSDRSLLTLGILLLELCFGSALEDHETRRRYDSLGGPHTATPDLTATLDLAVALEWSRSVGGEAGESYADAVNWCLRGQVAGARDEKWRQELFTNVVRPLQSCHEQLHSMGREEGLKAGLMV